MAVMTTTGIAGRHGARMGFGEASLDIFPFVIMPLVVIGLVRLVPIDEFLLRGIHQQHATDFAGIHAGKNAHERSAKRMRHENIRRRNLGVSQSRVKFASDLNCIARCGSERGEANARAVVRNGARELAHFRLHANPRFQGPAVRTAASGLKHDGWISLAANQ